MSKQIKLSLIERQRRNRHLLYASKLFTDAEIENYDNIYQKGNYPFDIASYHLNILQTRKQTNALMLVKNNVPIPKQGPLQLGGYKYKSKSKKAPAPQKPFAMGVVKRN